MLDRQREKQAQRRKIFRDKYSLAKGKAKVFFDFGQGRIYYNEKEVTSGFGLYTSIFTDGSWHDSQNVLWAIEKINDSFFIAEGKSTDLPLSQIWQITLVDDRTIDWDVSLRVYEYIKLEQLQASLILHQAYKNIDSPYLEGVSEDKSLPFSIRFMLKDSSMCNKKEVSRASFLDSQAFTFRYYADMDNYFKPAEYDNYLKARIEIDGK
ncbi:MAG: hypothetical protein JW734_08645 [Candidatus Omnitrophica bacterium]|nr:hypothetical protein [Candidatus Omnitrophota bacterium]